MEHWQVGYIDRYSLFSAYIKEQQAILFGIFHFDPFSTSKQYYESEDNKLYDIKISCIVRDDGSKEYIIKDRQHIENSIDVSHYDTWFYTIFKTQQDLIIELNASLKDKEEEIIDEIDEFIVEHILPNEDDDQESIIDVYRDDLNNILQRLMFQDSIENLYSLLCNLAAASQDDITHDTWMMNFQDYHTLQAYISQLASNQDSPFVDSETKEAIEVIDFLYQEYKILCNTPGKQTTKKESKQHNSQPSPQDLNEQLEAALKSEDYDLAAKLRDEIHKRK